jgi:hypothetical protein
VTFKLVIEQTPIAGAPILVNSQVVTTDVNGEATATINQTQSYAITTGVEAIAFTPLYDTGSNFAAQSPITIDAARLISSTQQPCRVVIGGAPNIYFTSVNQTDHPLTVPLDYPGINSMYSVTGQAVPQEVFAAGTTGFAVPEEYFDTGSGLGLSGVWKFLGQDITINAEPPVCSDTGVPGECQLLDPAALRSPFEYTKKVILKVTRASLDAARRGKWKSTNGKFSVPFLSRGAAALALMETVFRDSSGQQFVCEVTPMSCELRAVPKKKLVKAFSTIFAGKLPPGLSHIGASAKKEVKDFEKFLKKVPDRYTSCK